MDSACLLGSWCQSTTERLWHHEPSVLGLESASAAAFHSWCHSPHMSTTCLPYVMFQTRPAFMLLRSCPSLQRCCWKMMLLSLHPNIIVHVENVVSLFSSPSTSSQKVRKCGGHKFLSQAIIVCAGAGERECCGVSFLVPLPPTCLPHVMFQTRPSTCIAVRMRKTRPRIMSA